MTTMNTLSLASRHLLTFAALTAASLASGQDTPAPSLPADQSAAPSATASAAPTPAVAPAATTTGETLLPPADANSPVGGTLAGVLSGNSTATPVIQRLDMTQRDQLFNELSGRVQTADHRVSEIQQQTNGLNPDAQKTLEKAVADYNQAKAKLQQSMDACRAADAKTWERSRATLATDYAFYVAAAAGVELAAPNS